MALSRRLSSQLDDSRPALVPHLSRARRLDGRLEAVRKALVETLEEPSVLIQSGCDRAMTAEFLDLLGVRACRDRECHCCMPKAVRCERGEFGRANARNPNPSIEVRVSERDPSGDVNT